jgi:hypothetical protein
MKWVGLALIGLLIAAAVAIAASRLASQQIGLASEPISAGDALAPAVASPHAGRRPRKGHRHSFGAPTPTTSTPTTTAGPQPTTTTEPAPTEIPPVPTESQAHEDDSGGEGHGGGADD